MTAATPAFDIDILDPVAAAQIERLAKDRFEERGDIPVRFGKPPKRAIPFRTDAPFPKITVNVTAPDGSEGQKIELLCNGQQLVVDGIHPETKRPYNWHGGKLGDIKHEDLAYICEEEAHALVAEAVQILVAEFGYTAEPATKTKAGNGAEADGTDWSGINNLADHDDLVSFAMKLVKSGTHPGRHRHSTRS